MEECTATYVQMHDAVIIEVHVMMFMISIKKYVHHLSASTGTRDGINWNKRRHQFLSLLNTG